MRAPDRFEFTVQARHQREAMLAASKALMKGRNALVSHAITAALTILTGLGGAAIAALIARWADASTSWAMLTGWIAGSGLYLVSFQLLYNELARSIANRALHRPVQVITFNETGMIYDAAPSVWTILWSQIDDVVTTKQTITIVVADIAFGLPKSAVGDGRCGRGVGRRFGGADWQCMNRLA